MYLVLLMFQKAAEAATLDAAKEEERKIRKKYEQQKLGTKNSSGRKKVCVGIFLIVFVGYNVPKNNN